MPEKILGFGAKSQVHKRVADTYFYYEQVNSNG